MTYFSLIFIIEIKILKLEIKFYQIHKFKEFGLHKMEDDSKIKVILLRLKLE